MANSLDDDDGPIKTEYLREVFDPKELPKTIAYAVASISRFAKSTPFDAIAFTGVSGAALAFSLSALLQKSLLCVRKKEDGAHSKFDIEGNFDAKRYIIVDDFIDTGRTIDTIRSRIGVKICSHTKPVLKDCCIKLVGIYLYRPYESGTKGWARVGTNKSIPIIPERVEDCEPNVWLPHD